MASRSKSKPAAPPASGDPLAEYNARRDFSRTREPAGQVEPGEGRLFIVQKHDATRLHWDFRIEVDGVLKSWAVTKGPSLDPADKRLAVHTEDHPMAYAEFEGTIPKGEYGGGTVMLWDKGSWEPVEGKSARDLAKGHLHLRLFGERMKGEWLLIRLKPRPGEKRENWLLRKINDDYAGAGDALVNSGLTSVLTGRTMAEIAADSGGVQSLAGKRGEAFTRIMEAATEHNSKIAKARAAPPPAQAKPAAKPAAKRKPAARPPGFRPPQLATLVDAVPAGNGWLHEIKFDGYRALAAVAGDKVTIYTRKGLDWTDRFRPVADALAALDLPPALIDGEIVRRGADGNPSFSALQEALGAGGQGIEYFAFDLLEENGRDCTSMSQIERSDRLAALLRGAQAPIHLSDYVVGAGEQLFRSMCEAGQEGIIAKRIDAPYRSRRSTAWVKVKCTNRQEFVVVGWTRSTARGRPFAALLLAQEEGGTLVYKGKVGTGFDGDTLQRLAEAMAPLATDTPPVEVKRSEVRGAQWIRPELVAEVAFAEFTAGEGEAGGRVRHGSFVGLRQDKAARDVTPETPVPVPSASADYRITSRERVIFPDSGQTKGELADYYAAVGPLMLPTMARRPISLVRCPQGRGKKCFFQKHDSGSFGEHVRHVPVPEKNGSVEDYLYVEDVEGIMACVQMGTIEFHGWCSRVDTLELPDRMVFDLDPDEGLDCKDVKRAAADIRRTLADIGLQSFALLSGGKGVHVVVPLTPGHDWDRHKSFAHRFAEALATAEPDRYVATITKAKRVGKIFIDYLRNQRGATAVMPYSARARPGAPVAVPVSWDELADADNAHIHSIGDIDALLTRARSRSLHGWGLAEQRLPDL